MVKITYCDRCEKELKRKEKWEEGVFDFDDIFDNGFGNVSEVTFGGKNVQLPKRVIKAQLCEKCIVGYNDIIGKTNREVKEYLSEKEVDKSSIGKRKKRFG